MLQIKVDSVCGDGSRGVGLVAPEAATLLVTARPGLRGIELFRQRSRQVRSIWYRHHEFVGRELVRTDGELTHGCSSDVEEGS
jgi:hypothetical protein